MVTNGPNRTFVYGAANGRKEPILLKNSKLGQSMEKSENNVLSIQAWVANNVYFGGD